jgi:hypothetical protein
VADLHLSFPGNISGLLKIPDDMQDNADMRQQLAAHAPGIKFLDSPPPQKPLLSLEYIPATTPRLVVEGLHAKLYGSPGNGFPADIPHLLYGLERKALLERRLYPVHAACVGKDGAYALLVGHSGSGKTTLAIELIGQNGLKLFSGNKTIVSFDNGSVKAVAGTRIMTAVGKDFGRYAYDLPSSNYAVEQEVRISRIAIIRINDGVEECQILNPLSALHMLYPYFLDVVNANVIVNGKDVFNGAAPAEVGQHLAEHLGAALQILQVRKISGSIPFMRQKALTA